MRYAINFSRTINQLVPHYIGGRKLILYLQAILQPLQTLNDAFVAWARETRIEASMTSQVFKLEWFLNYRLSKYFKDSAQKISIINQKFHGTALYEDTPGTKEQKVLLYFQDTESKNFVLYKASDEAQANDCSFMVYSPAINPTKITLDEYRALLAYYVDTYKLPSKSYLIILQEQ